MDEPKLAKDYLSGACCKTCAFYQDFLIRTDIDYVTGKMSDIKVKSCGYIVALNPTKYDWEANEQHPHKDALVDIDYYCERYSKKKIKKKVGI